MQKSITGVMMYYYKVCQRKLWYFYHDIEMEQTNENVSIGKLLDEASYTGSEKHINIDNVINIDFIKASSILHEIKKSRKIEEAAIFQVKYYLYYLYKRQVKNIKGKIDYPLLKQTLNIELSETDFGEIEAALCDIRLITSSNVPPKLAKKTICKACAYYDLCFI